MDRLINENAVLSAIGEWIAHNEHTYTNATEYLKNRVKAIKTAEQEPTEKCTWIKYDYRTMCPKGHIDVDNPYWRIPENRMETLKYCPYCGKEIEVEE